MADTKVIRSTMPFYYTPYILLPLDGLLLLGYTDGPLFRFHITYVLLANTALIILCAAGWLRSEPGERSRFVLLIAATILPIAVEAFSLTPVQGFSSVTSTLLLLYVLNSISCRKNPHAERRTE